MYYYIQKGIIQDNDVKLNDTPVDYLLFDTEQEAIEYANKIKRNLKKGELLVIVKGK